MIEIIKRQIICSLHKRYEPSAGLSYLDIKRGLEENNIAAFTKNELSEALSQLTKEGQIREWVRRPSNIKYYVRVKRNRLETQLKESEEDRKTWPPWMLYGEKCSTGKDVRMRLKWELFKKKLLEEDAITDSELIKKLRALRERKFALVEIAGALIRERPELTTELIPQLIKTYRVCQGPNLPENQVALDELYDHIFIKNCPKCINHLKEVIGI